MCWAKVRHRSVAALSLANSHTLVRRCAGAINSMALPPILNYGSEYLKNKVARDVVTGRKHICLAISEPTAGRLECAVS